LTLELVDEYIFENNNLSFEKMVMKNVSCNYYKNNAMVLNLRIHLIVHSAHLEYCLVFIRIKYPIFLKQARNYLQFNLINGQNNDAQFEFIHKNGPNSVNESFNEPIFSNISVRENMIRSSNDEKISSL
jgi:subtilase family serine protease